MHLDLLTVIQKPDNVCAQVVCSLFTRGGSQALSKPSGGCRKTWTLFGSQAHSQHIQPLTLALYRTNEDKVLFSGIVLLIVDLTQLELHYTMIINQCQFCFRC